MSQKFFCDNCSTLVDKNAMRCPHCGRYFKSVKCPKCGFAGSPDLFADGCPSCGYAQEELQRGIDFYDIEPGRGRARKNRSFSDRFYKRVLPVLLILLIVLIVLIVRSGW